MLKLTQLRVARGLSKAELSRLAKVDHSAVSKIETGRVVPYPGELLRLAETLGVAPDETHSLLSPVKGQVGP